jgi:hypothetical protein
MGREEMEAQRIMSELQNRGGPGGLNLPTSGNICSQCKMMHPPIAPGQTCPMKPVENLSGINDIEVNKFLNNMKNILISQMQKRNLKDGKKFFQYAIIELTKALERYSE